jgi:hypothetical protein
MGRAGIELRPGATSAVVDFVLTQRHPVWDDFGVARVIQRSLTLGYGGDLGILRAVCAFVSFRTPWVVCRCGSRFLSSLMGRAGIEPATLGLKVDASALVRSREPS